MVIYKEDKKLGLHKCIIECDCHSHSIQLDRIDSLDGKWDGEIYVSFWTDTFGLKKSFFHRLRTKLKKIWNTIIGRDYRIDQEIVLTKEDIQNVIQELTKIVEDKGEK